MYGVVSHHSSSKLKTNNLNRKTRRKVTKLKMGKLDQVSNNSTQVLRSRQALDNDG